MAHVRAETPVRSSLSVPLPYQGATIGALNIYSTQPAAFASTESLAAGLEAAEVIAVAVANADAHWQLGEQARNMRLAMDSRAVIEQAKGVLMAQRQVNAEQAFEILREASQRYNRKLRDIALGIVESTQGTAVSPGRVQRGQPRHEELHRRRAVHGLGDLDRGAAPPTRSGGRPASGRGRRRARCPRRRRGAPCRASRGGSPR